MQASVFQANGLSIDRHVPAILGVWLGLNALDALLTLYLLGVGGIEANPMLSAMQSEMGAVGMLLTKFGLAGFAGISLIAKGRPALLNLANKLMGVVVVYNAVIAAYVLAPGATMPFIS